MPSLSLALPHFCLLTGIPEMSDIIKPHKAHAPSLGHVRIIWHFPPLSLFSLPIHDTFHWCLSALFSRR